MNKSERYNALYMDIAYRVASMSYCQRKQVGAIAVKDGRIISMGWNGQPAGFDNVCEDDNNTTLSTVLHAEFNLLTKLTRCTESSNDAIMYVTCSPCLNCSKMIAASGIKKVYYNEDYRSNEGIEYLIRLGIEVEKI